MTEALFVIDMVNDFRGGVLANPRMELIIPHVLRLIEQKKRTGCLIYFICDCHQVSDAELKLFPPHCMEGTWGAEVIDELQPFILPDRSNVIPKKTYNGFFETRLANEIKSRKIDNTTLVGVLAEMCITYTAEGFFYRGCRIDIPECCVETFDAPDHDARVVKQNALTNLKNHFGAHIIAQQQ